MLSLYRSSEGAVMLVAPNAMLLSKVARPNVKLSPPTPLTPVPMIIEKLLLTEGTSLL